MAWPGWRPQISGGWQALRLSAPGQSCSRSQCSLPRSVAATVGPVLRGVAERRDRAWLIDFIINPANVLARKDPVALALAARFPGVRMPLMGLGETDAADLIAYLRDQTSRLSVSARSSAVPK